MTGIKSFALSLLVVFSLLAPATAFATELRVGATASIDYQRRPFAFANAILRTERIEDTFSVRVGPTYRLIDREGRLLYEIFSRTEYEAFLNESRSLNAWEQFLGGELSYALGPNTLLSFDERFAYQASARFDENTDVGTGVLDVGRDRFFRNNLEGTLSHQLGPRTSVALTGNYNLIDYRDVGDLRSDEYGLSATLSANYRVTKADTIGLGYGFSFEDIADRSQTDFHRAFASWTHVFDPTLVFSVQGGPAWIEQEIASRVVQVNVGTDSMPIFTPVTIPESVQNSTTVFGFAQVSKAWNDFEGLVSYRRQESAATGDGSPTSFDQARARVTWDFDSHWDLIVAGGWNRRESFTSGTGGIDVSQWNALLSLRRRLTNFSNATLQFRFFDQNNNADSARVPNTRNYFVSIRIDYGLQPFHFDL